MYETSTLSVPKIAAKIFLFMLSFYPVRYRKRFGQEMLFVFEDLCKEELEKHQKLTVNFLFQELADVTISIVQEHIHEVQQKGMKKYLQQTLHINKFNVIGGVLLLPAFLVLCIDIISRIAQGDLVHYNRLVYNLLSHTPLYWQPILFTWIIVFPFLAVLINTIPLIKNVIKNNGHVKDMRFLIQNLITVLLIFFGTFFILLVKFHDFGPCILHGIARLGFEHFTHIVAVCKKT